MAKHVPPLPPLPPLFPPQTASQPAVPTPPQFPLAQLQQNSSGSVHGQLDSSFEKKHAKLIENLPASTWTQHAVPSVKTLRDKFRVMMCTPRNTDASNAAASGISEEITQLDQVLDDMIREKNSEEEETKTKRNEASAREAELIKTGLTIRPEASARPKKESKEEKKGRHTGHNRGCKEFEGDDALNDIVRKDLEEKREQNRLWNELRSQELALMRERFEQDKLDRQIAREHNAKQIEFMEAIINKLN